MRTQIKLFSCFNTVYVGLTETCVTIRVNIFFCTIDNTDTICVPCIIWKRRWSGSYIHIQQVNLQISQYIMISLIWRYTPRLYVSIYQCYIIMDSESPDKHVNHAHNDMKLHQLHMYEWPFSCDALYLNASIYLLHIQDLFIKKERYILSKYKYFFPS